jgi:hypothetical protein
VHKILLKPGLLTFIAHHYCRYTLPSLPQKVGFEPGQSDSSTTYYANSYFFASFETAIHFRTSVCSASQWAGTPSLDLQAKYRQRQARVHQHCSPKHISHQQKVQQYQRGDQGKIACPQQFLCKQYQIALVLRHKARR